MRQKQFETANAALWDEIKAILENRQEDKRHLPALYRRLCQGLALCRQRGYSPVLTDDLQQLVAQCHRRLYGSVPEHQSRFMQMVLVDFPCRVRAEWRLMLLVTLLFVGVCATVGLLVWYDPHWAYSFASSKDLNDYRNMYQPSNMRMGRGDQGDMMMFGVYIWNNVSIDFKAFAGGIFGGIFALLVVGFNAMHMAVIAAWLSKDPATASTFWPFVVTHCSFELVGMLLSAMAGLRLGLALISPGRRSRAHALYSTSQYIFPVLVGAALMTFAAAFFEAFFSASGSIPPSVKYGVGALCWTLVIGFLLFAGRGKR